ncbi:ddhd domain-containing protein [Ophiostoma piceae UAMH 11346]|uniref:Ddhd domain-containing protein n=1 Tax=Ophiostoma piceae (strain UAMH 11346) TaxID=1262450 RepID=S3C7A8_OPHP1|nr:ddhd domain-containing protein [Ophiostoma piceae UAMH 11346]
MANSSLPQPSPAAGQPEQHTYGPHCRLAAVPQPHPGAWLEGISPSKAQYFYSSLISIDDPLSASTGDAKSPKQPLRPFSEEDNNALEASWLGLSTKQYRENHAAAKSGHSPEASVAKSNEEVVALVVQNLTARHCLKHARDDAFVSDTGATIRATHRGATASMSACCDELYSDAALELSKLFCPLATMQLSVVNVDKVVRRVIVAMGKKARTASTGLSPNTAPESIVLQGTSLTQQLENAGIRRGEQAASSLDNEPTTELQDSPEDTPVPVQPAIVSSSTVVPLPIRAPVADDGISGTPFLRVETPSSSLQDSLPIASLPRYDKAGVSNKSASAPDTINGDSVQSQDLHDTPSVAPSPQMPDRAIDECNYLHEVEALKAEIQETSDLLLGLVASAKVAVGVSRLHTVDLPSLQMKPIYWSPVNDISIVQRATWFYQDTMLPVEAAVSNQLELHYRELRPWSETWAVELRCAIDIGPVGEEKISQPLWPKPIRRSSKVKQASLVSEPEISRDPYCAAHCHLGAAAAEGTLEPRDVPSRSGSVTNDASAAVVAASSSNVFANYHVAYKNGKAAFLLKPSLKSSAYYSRRPISKIMKGATVGIPVIRGFDRNAWDRIYDKTHKVQSVSVPKQPLPVSTRTGAEERITGSSCPGCETKKRGYQVTDLVLVVHGVGQKLAERVESFHFTHAVNGLRRAMNVELKQPAVRSILREGQNGVMVLPVNWRHTLSFEEGGFAEAPGQAGPSSAADSFGLKDIEPNSIPAVRSMISDVMFDIPFYMSHHKPKMIQSLVREANRVYRLWCQNNPGFAENGRTHLIGHSLGSAMSIEVLSKQPTSVSPVDLSITPPESRYFEFDTKNLFLLGSPSAFFLLLERGALIPRLGRQKPGVDSQDSQDSRVAGKAGSFGCLAVDNIYNILAKEDPIAYLLNGTIDTAYAASLKTAYVPSANVGFLTSIGNSLRSVVPGAAAGPHAADTSLNVPPSMPAIVRLPSQLELEIHDFTREDIAERKAYLLNDNGQIDYYLQSGGGPLEIQYLNMLSAHTSYWTNHDLIRMLCVEIGRRPGKSHALPAMRAVKSAKRVIPGTAQT